jgi:glycosyltransferase involved in cell wall biosynthesis
MDILHISNTHIEVDSRILKELKSLSKNKENKILALGIRSRKNVSDNTLNYKNIRIISVNLFATRLNFLNRNIRHLLTFISFFFKVLMHTRGIKFEVIHCHDTLVLPIGYLLKKIKKSKLIYDAHELESNKNGQSKLMSWCTLFIEKKCWKSIDLLISVSESIIKWYQENLGIKKSILVLNSPEIRKSDLSLNKISSVRGNYFHKEFNINNSTLIFLYLGFLTKGRGIEKIIDAFDSDQINSHVVFVGYGNMKDYILKASKNNRKIHYHEAVKHDEVVKLSRNADVGLCLIEKISLSDYYCLPNKLFEYAFSGLPVLASDFPELKKMVHKFKLGLCCKIKTRAIEVAIKKIERNPLPKVDSDLSELSWKSQENKLINAYSSI